MTSESGVERGSGAALHDHGAGDVLAIEDAEGRTRLIQATSEQTLAQVLFLEGLWPTKPFCSGLGRCGHCLVYVVDDSEPSPNTPTTDERKTLSPEVLEQGGRLACRRQSESGLRVRLPFAFPRTAAESAAAFESNGIALERAVSGSLALAVDLGTTSLHWQLLDDKGVLAQGRELNPQLAAGSEVMSRLGFALAAPGNARMLRDVVLRRLHELTMALPAPVDRICVAGNTVMTALLLEWPLKGLAAAPYQKPHAGGFWTRLPFQETSLELSDHHAPGNAEGRHGGRTYIPPQPAPFIGGDLSAGLAALHFTAASPPAFPFLLADLGTNGEFILALGQERYLAASVPMGPALEGIGMSCGATALPGVWVDVVVTPFGLRPRPLEDPDGGNSDTGGTEHIDVPRSKPDRQRISGTGYLALLAGLLRLGLLDRTGGFAAGDSPLARRVGLGLADRDGERRFLLGPDVYLTGRDVEEVLKVKAAFNLAFSRLLAEGGIQPEALRAVYLAGALGEHADFSALEELGFVPPGYRRRIHPVGNSSLAGAALLVNSPEARDWIERIAPMITTLNIGQEPDFFSHYTQRLVFRHV
ncbi:ASKHA domain-containing protein [Desulfonatronum thiodismutans]|uniref:ASKHA domain-containing protein n=1 Tax=Desulfonatronum thiodismutans TaxID=159290 RepID=UPI00068BB343|nr:ASKHA domain-containing protein [Desulfonatronum thiodismutans]